MSNHGGRGLPSGVPYPNKTGEGMKKEWTNDQAEKDFKKKLLDRTPNSKGHNPEFDWDNMNTRSRWDSLLVTCSKGCQFRDGAWYSEEQKVSYGVRGIAYGRLSISGFKFFNEHLMSLEPNTVFEEPTKVLQVTLTRVSHEWWVTHYESDWAEELRDGTRWYGGDRNHPWLVVRKDSKGWRLRDHQQTKDAAIGKCLDERLKYLAAGHAVEVCTEENTTGLIAPAATIQGAVKGLINDYKGLRDNATPIEVNEWMKKANDAISQMELLEQFRDDVNNRLLESMEF